MVKRSRDIQVKFRLSEEEAEQLRKKIEASGMSQQEYLLKSALNQNVTNTDGLKELSYELKKIGVNLNQIAKKCNEDDILSVKVFIDVKRIREELSTIWQSLRRYLQEQE